MPSICVFFNSRKNIKNLQRICNIKNIIQYLLTLNKKYNMNKYL